MNKDSKQNIIAATDRRNYLHAVFRSTIFDIFLCSSFLLFYILTGIFVYFAVFSLFVSVTILLSLHGNIYYINYFIIEDDSCLICYQKYNKEHTLKSDLKDLKVQLSTGLGSGISSLQIVLYKDNIKLFKQNHVFYYDRKRLIEIYLWMKLRKNEEFKYYDKKLIKQYKIEI